MRESFVGVTKCHLFLISLMSLKIPFCKQICINCIFSFSAIALHNIVFHKTSLFLKFLFLSSSVMTLEKGDGGRQHWHDFTNMKWVLTKDKV